MGGLVYFSSASGNTARFVARLGIPAQRIPVRPDDPLPMPDGPYVLICPTYADGQGRGAVAKPVIRFLNDPARRALLRGVIAGGNRNFGATYGLAAEVISGKCAVPILFKFELAGTETDVARVRAGLDEFWGMECSTAL
ncbi:MAG: class Ib ribonucleoside-diphosphate reductase assembly flavoprotein NrdI [Rhodobacterales bacterium]|uniref:class Ib ribonucleoside-diphosphate reductase assembly flavoprotein NrdI n=1 Tax=Gemmobacter nectariphilus TaxID=220343 RepID=UPI0003F8CCBA|nr:class Ib ribonucleoside-diphosphate reductase assembly flavoprotein NrdI [Gemmobacter nectariphilus]MDX5357236.1 class Ib ribonucleoside-diphosphate reductase assembly flavoprotein NrdI [Rhodobacterales bacterium]MDX5499492.1 class Ib ribonucleoside-diphosphate reductase assembly flavoprotein NrdI [Rhodobacterales bacterium]